MEPNPTEPGDTTQTVKSAIASLMRLLETLTPLT